MAGLAALVVLLAVDSALLRYIATPDRRGMPGTGLKAYLLVVLPVANGLILAIPRFFDRRSRGPSFLEGVEVAGWGAVLGYGVACRLCPVAIPTYFNSVFGPIYNGLAKYSDLGNPTASELFMWFIMFPACSLALSTPLWMVATCGGLIGHRAASRV